MVWQLRSEWKTPAFLTLLHSWFKRPKITMYLTRRLIRMRSDGFFPRVLHCSYILGYGTYIFRINITHVYLLPKRYSISSSNLTFTMDRFYSKQTSVLNFKWKLVCSWFLLLILRLACLHISNRSKDSCPNSSIFWPFQHK